MLITGLPCRFANRLALPAVLVALAIVAPGCGTTVLPPKNPVNPVTVFLLDHGRTTSLVLPVEGGAGSAGGGGTLVRYAYGDWNWYALERNGLIDGCLALFWPTQATLARRELEGPGPGETQAAAVRRQVKEIDHVHEIPVGRADLRRLTGRLESHYRANLHTAVEGKLSDFTFVHHPRPYTAFGNSNHQVSDWLRDLGCGIRGFAFFADWSVRRPPASPSPGSSADRHTTVGWAGHQGRLCRVVAGAGSSPSLCR